MITSLDDAYEVIDRLRQQRDAAQAENADLRRQLAEAQAAIELGSVANDGAKAVMLDMRQQRDAAQAENADLRRQLDEANAEIAAVPREEIVELRYLIESSTTAISLDCPAGWSVREWLETYDDTPATGEGEN